MKDTQHTTSLTDEAPYMLTAETRQKVHRMALISLMSYPPAHLTHFLQLDEKQWKNPPNVWDWNGMYKRVMKMYPYIGVETNGQHDSKSFSDTNRKGERFSFSECIPKMNDTKKRLLDIMELAYLKIRSMIDNHHLFAISESYEMIGEDYDGADRMQSRLDKITNNEAHGCYFVYSEYLFAALYILSIRNIVSDVELQSLLKSYVYLPPPTCGSCGYQDKDEQFSANRYQRCPHCLQLFCLPSRDSDMFGNPTKPGGAKTKLRCLEQHIEQHHPNK